MDKIFKFKKKKNYKFIISLILALYFIIAGIFSGLNLHNWAEYNNQIDANLKKGNLVVSFIDVGQGDSILIEAPTGEKMLIDAGGTKEDASYNYIKSRNIDTIDTIIITHPHSDHISEIANIISNFNVNKIYMPKVSHTSKTFENMIDTIYENNITVIEAFAGEYINFAEDISCLIVAPNSTSYSELNNYSVVLHLTYKESTFLFTGDAEVISENEILENNFNIKSDVLKVGHHGSSTSTSEDFLDAISPVYAIISCGKDNPYGHPSQNTLLNLSQKNINTYITADYGNVILTSNGYDISILE